jgi:predicted DNA-binding transcriptional regulator AlpA
MKKQPIERRAFRLREIAQMCGITEQHLRDHAAELGPPSRTIGTVKLWSKEAIDRWLANTDERAGSMC